MNGFNGGQQQETKYSAEQGFQGQEHHPPASETPPASTPYQAGADIFSRYKLEQTIRQLHGIHSADQRPGFGGTPFTGV